MKQKIRLLLVFLSFGLKLTSYAQNWDEIIKLSAKDRASSDNFGYSVAIDGEFAIVGAPYNSYDTIGSKSVSWAGAAYIFKLENNSWIQQAKIVANDRASNDNFGLSVAISGNKAIVGAYKNSTDVNNLNTISASGSAYVFKFENNVWKQEAKLVAKDRGVNDLFGYSVGISNNYAIIGAYNDAEDSNGQNTLAVSGSAYVFKFESNNWIEQTKVVPNDRALYDSFGFSVAIDGDNAIVASYKDDEDNNGSNTLANSGSAYIFSLVNNNWIQTAKLTASDRAANDLFGISVSISKNRAIVGSYQDDEDANNLNSKADAGSAYIYILENNLWRQEAKIVAKDRGIGDFFGISVAISNNQIIVSAVRDADDSNGLNPLVTAGSAYIFILENNSWVQKNKITPKDRGLNDYFGKSVAISGNNIIIGAFQEDEDINNTNTKSNAGSAYIFNKSVVSEIQDKNLDSHSTIYPNPSLGNFNLNLLTNTYLYISTYKGEKIFEKNFSSGYHSINLTDLNEGIYYSTFVSEDKTTTYKIVILK